MWGFGSLGVGGIAVVVIVVRGMSLKVARAAQGRTCFTEVERALAEIMRNDSVYLPTQGCGMCIQESG